MNNKNNKISPWFVVFIMMVCTLIVALLWLSRNERVQPNAEQSAISVQDTNAQIVADDPAPAEKPTNNVAPETEAALNKVGYTATKLIPVRVTIQNNK